MTRDKVGGRPNSEEDDVKRLQQALRKLRDDRFAGSGVELARALHLSQSGISQLLSGKTTPSLATVRRIARLCGLSIGDLLDGREAEPFPNRALAARLAHDAGLPEHAIREVLAEAITEDLPAFTWLKRIEARAILGAAGKVA
jgi:transcriptional regulator with XRE-family HTH domain